MTDWKKQFKDWKLAAALALVFALCGHPVPHIETVLAEYGPTTSFTLQVSGANTPNVTAHTVTTHPWVTR